LNIVLFGPPGAGKGTQSQFLTDKFALTHVSTGDLLRAAIKNKTALGLEAKRYMDAGELVPDAIVIGLIKEVMTKNMGKGMLLDGFPRNTNQAQALDSLLGQENSNIRRAVFLEVDRQLLKMRLTGRRVCTKCGAAFHIALRPPKNEGVCDVCGGTLEHRPDDKPEVIDNRLEVYDKNTAPLKTYYQKAGKFIAVDGVGDPEAVFERISAALN
jgi:adenylate kinase